MTDMLEPNINETEMARTTSEPELNGEMVVKAPMLEPKLKGKSLKKMTIKKKIIKKVTEPKRVNDVVVEGEIHNEEASAQVDPQPTKKRA